jgi:hypothetical protein
VRVIVKRVLEYVGTTDPWSIMKHNCKQQVSKYTKYERLGHLARYVFGNKAKGEEVKKLMREVIKNERRKEKLEKVRVTRLIRRKEFSKRL